MPSATPDETARLNQDALYGGWYYEHYAGGDYHDPSHWGPFFGSVADAVVAELAPKTVLDAGCARGFLVKAFRERGVDAEGFDLSQHAIETAEDEVKDHVRVGSLTEPIDGRYDLITCIEVIEHLDPTGVAAAVANLTAATDRILFSSAPEDFADATHTALKPPETWAAMFASHGFFRSDHDAGYLSPWAVLFERQEPSLVEVVRTQERIVARLQREVVHQRQTLLSQAAEFDRLSSAGGALAEAEEARRSAETTSKVNEDLHLEILRLRDELLGNQAELTQLRSRVPELEAQIHGFAPLVAAYSDLEAQRDSALRQITTMGNFLNRAVGKVRSVRNRS